MKFPDFYGIGVQKAGTTWLHAQLSKHPSVFMPPLKEIQYFNHLYLPDHRTWTDEHRLSRIKKMIAHRLEQHKVDYASVEYLAKCGKNELNDIWYANFFSPSKPGQIAGEITPEYSLLPEVGIEHMVRLNPDAKFILLLRHPVDRDFSHAKMILDHRGQVEKVDFDANDEIEKQILDILDFKGVYERSDYKGIIEQWRNTIPNPDNFMIDFYDNVKHYPKALLEKVCGFLEIEYDEVHFKNLEEVVFEGRKMKITAAIREKLLARHLETIRYINAEFGEKYGISWYEA
ncbi:sulfotransferase [Sulfuricurvum sp.]|uniref:sulfotransferase family protein n=1 Tax=Sulfuricurvum sp. TaxID=2025608 RepID=UPI002639FB8C|nr:sulfotransferase [Sulfuricurvum sp.]MDD2781546.1 sulfotransferase [Sulfuricurvum sp.]